MSLSILLRPLARRSVLATFGALIVAIIGIKIFDFRFRPYVPRHIPLQLFIFVYNAVAIGALLSFGGFLARMLTELETIRLARNLPGLRRKVHGGILLLAIIVPTLATLFLRLNLPEQFEKVPATTLWSVHVFLFALGLGIRGTWLMPALAAILLLKASWLLLQLKTAPSLSAAVALAGAGAVLTLRHRRFLPPLTAQPNAWRNWRWLNLPFSPSARSVRGTDAAINDRPGLSLPNTHAFSLVRAGSFERFGQRRGRQLGAIGLWTACLFLTFAPLAYSASLSPAAKGAHQFCVDLFTSEQPSQTAQVMRHLFAALTGGVAYLAAVTLDGTLRPSLWHPISRRRQSSAVFLSHLHQNFWFAIIVAALSCGILAAAGHIVGAPPSSIAVRAFVMPALISFLLMPIPQALFPNGPDAFHRRVNPFKQTFAGLLGGGLSLLTAYWTAYWPLKSWHEAFPVWCRVGLMIAAVLAVYATYFVVLRYRYSRSDLRPRIA